MPSTLKTTGEAAVEAYLAGRSGDRPVTFIEGGYVDNRDPGAADRVEHFHDSFRLIQLLKATPRPPAILRSFLVNDFSPATYCGNDFSQATDCGAAECRASQTRADSAGMLPAWAAGPDAGAADCSPVRVYGMRNTRNRAVKHIARLLRRPDRNGLRIAEDGDVIDIYTDTDDGEVFLGYRKRGPQGVFVRCTALMAQHYFDLYSHAAKVCPGMTDFWVFDFNRAVEAERVRAGACASFAIYPWPVAIRARIVNCVYYPGRPDLKPVRLTERQ
jgi:hypothetical protein